MTSQPYWGLRDYGDAGQIGLEPTPEAYVIRLVEVFREVRRVLRADGTLWLNIGDSYAGSSQTGGTKSISGNMKSQPHCKKKQLLGDLKPKDLVGIPWRVAFALQADGWWLRSEIIWAKPNPMPESVRDRPTKAHEQVFLLAKNAKYYYDADAIKELAAYGQPNSPESIASPYGQGFTRRAGAFNGSKSGKTGADGDRNDGGRAAVEGDGFRNKRTVWTLATLPTPDAHFATFPIELPETCILAGCPPDGVVLDPFCGAATTGLACVKNGRKFIGIELNPKYIEIAKTRMQRHYSLLGAEPA